MFWKTKNINFILALILTVNSAAPAGKKYDPSTLVFPSFLHTMGIRKATKTHLMLYTRNRVKVRNPLGLAVARLDSWDDSDDKGDDDQVTGYGINSGQNLIVYNKSMTSLGFYGISARGEERLASPSGVAANSKGDVYVADRGNHRIVHLFNPKKDLRFNKAIGSRGNLPRQFESPEGIALDSHDFLYVCDSGNDRIQVLTPQSDVQLIFGSTGVEDGFLDHPASIAVTDGKERWSHFKDSFLVVVDLRGQRLQKFSLKGEFIKSIRLNDFGYPDGRLHSLAIDYYSNIWVTDFGSHCVHKFDRNLNYLTTVGRKGKGHKEFLEPRGIAIHKRFGQVFVVERESAQYYWIGTDVFDLNAEWHFDEGYLAISFFLTEPSFVSLEIHGEDRSITPFSKRRFYTGTQNVYLEGDLEEIPGYRLRVFLKDAQGNASSLSVTEPGDYKIILKVEPTYSSYKYFSKVIEAAFTIQ